MSKKLILIFTALVLAGLTAQGNDRIKNFKQVELFAFDCGETYRGKKGINAIEWNSDEAILRVLKQDAVSLEEEVLEYQVTDTFEGLLTLTMLGKPIDGSKGSIQFMLRDKTPSTVVINSRGVSYVRCEIQTK